MGAILSCGSLFRLLAGSSLAWLAAFFLCPTANSLLLLSQTATMLDLNYPHPLIYGVLTSRRENHFSPPNNGINLKK